MVLNWILFAGFGVLAYIGVSLMGQLTGGAATSAVGAGLDLFRPYALIALVVGNILWAVALFYGLKETKDAIPALIGVGVLTSFVYSVLFLGDTITIWHILGLALVLVGIYFLA